MQGIILLLSCTNIGFYKWDIKRGGETVRGKELEGISSSKFGNEK